MLDKIYVVSLPFALDRRHYIKKHLKIPFEFFDAYDKYASKDYLKKINKSVNTVESNSWWAKLGCKISHISCLQTAINKGYNNVLILEDDVLIKDDFYNLLPIYLKELPLDWNFLFLGYFIKNKVNVDVQNVSKQISEHLYTLTSSHGAHAILYNLKSEGFQKYFSALTNKFLLDKHYDLEMHEICNLLDITRYAVYPQYVAQKEGESYISKRMKNWDLDQNDPRYDLLKSGTVYSEDYKYINRLNEGEYNVLYKGETVTAKFIKGHFIFQNQIIYPKYYKHC